MLWMGRCLSAVAFWASCLLVTRCSRDLINLDDAEIHPGHPEDPYFVKLKVVSITGLPKGARRISTVGLTRSTTKTFVRVVGEGHSKETSVVAGDTDPVWNEDMGVYGKDGNLTFEVWDEGHSSPVATAVLPPISTLKWLVPVLVDLNIEDHPGAVMCVIIMAKFRDVSGMARILRSKKRFDNAINYYNDSLTVKLDKQINKWAGTAYPRWFTQQTPMYVTIRRYIGRNRADLHIFERSKAYSKIWISVAGMPELEQFKVRYRDCGYFCQRHLKVAGGSEKSKGSLDYFRETIVDNIPLEWLPRLAISVSQIKHTYNTTAKAFLEGLRKANGPENPKEFKWEPNMTFNDAKAMLQGLSFDNEKKDLFARGPTCMFQYRFNGEHADLKVYGYWKNWQSPQPIVVDMKYLDENKYKGNRRTHTVRGQMKRVQDHGIAQECAISDLLNPDLDKVLLLINKLSPAEKAVEVPLHKLFPML